MEIRKSIKILKIIFQLLFKTPATVKYLLLGRRISFYSVLKPGVFISKGVRTGKQVFVDRNTVIEGNINIGNNCFIGKNVIIKGKVKIDNNCKIEDNVSINSIGFQRMVLIGNDSVIEKHVQLFGNISIGEKTDIGAYTQITTSTNGICNIGNDVLVNTFTTLGASRLLEIKDHCIFAPYVQITDSTHNFDNINVPIKHSGLKSEATCVEEDVWLGSGVIILMGCTIGKGSVIGARSVVTKTIPPYSVAVGVPSIVKKSRI